MCHQGQTTFKKIKKFIRAKLLWRSPDTHRSCFSVFSSSTLSSSLCASSQSCFEFISTSMEPHRKAKNLSDSTFGDNKISIGIIVAIQWDFQNNKNKHSFHHLNRQFLSSFWRDNDSDLFDPVIRSIALRFCLLPTDPNHQAPRSEIR